MNYKKIIGDVIYGHEAIVGVTVGAVSEEQIKKYIENQSDEPGSFKVWDEPEEPEKDMADLKSD